MSGFRSLKIYERSYKAALAIYKTTEQFPKEEKYLLTDQLRRAALSIPLNIAEGYGKKMNQADFRRYLLMALGSNNEVTVLIDFAKDLELIDDEVYRKAKSEYEEIGKMLTGFIKEVGNKSSKF